MSGRREERELEGFLRDVDEVGEPWGGEIRGSPQGSQDPPKLSLLEEGLLDETPPKFDLVGSIFAAPRTSRGFSQESKGWEAFLQPPPPRWGSPQEAKGKEAPPPGSPFPALEALQGAGGVGGWGSAGVFLC